MYRFTNYYVPLLAPTILNINLSVLMSLGYSHNYEFYDERHRSNFVKND